MDDHIGQVVEHIRNNALISIERGLHLVPVHARDLLQITNDINTNLGLYGVYLCGPTECFLHGLFTSEERAIKWGEEYGDYIVRPVNNIRKLIFDLSIG